MVNIIAPIPSAIAAPFHPPTEGLQHDNLIRPIIPKTEIIASYTKLREDEEQARFSNQARSLIQNENEQHRETDEQQQQSAERRRLNFFSKNSAREGDYESKELELIKDFKLVMLVIQKKYNNAVTPSLDPTIDYLL